MEGDRVTVSERWAGRCLPGQLAVLAAIGCSRHPRGRGRGSRGRLCSPGSARSNPLRPEERDGVEGPRWGSSPCRAELVAQGMRPRQEAVILVVLSSLPRPSDGRPRVPWGRGPAWGRGGRARPMFREGLIPPGTSDSMGPSRGPVRMPGDLALAPLRVGGRRGVGAPLPHHRRCPAVVPVVPLAQRTPRERSRGVPGPCRVPAAPPLPGRSWSPHGPAGLSGPCGRARGEVVEGSRPPRHAAMCT
jgi:hypothetical protein